MKCYFVMDPIGKEDDRTALCVYISDNCKVTETDTDIIVNDGEKDHKFPKGTYVFSQRCAADFGKWGNTNG